MFGLGRHKSYITKEGYKQKYKPKSPEAREDGYYVTLNTKFQNRM